MTDICPLIITASNVTIQTLNRLLLNLRNGDANNLDVYSDFFAIITSTTTPTSDSTPPTSPPLTTLPDPNPYRNLSMADVESLILSTPSLTADPNSMYQFLVLDDEGVANETVIIAERAYDLHDDEEEVPNASDSDYDIYDNNLQTDRQQQPVEKLEAFNKFRVPWHEAQNAWACLHVATIMFEEMCEDMDGDRWWRYGLSEVTEETQREKRKTVEAAVEKMRKETDGLV